MATQTADSLWWRDGVVYQICPRRFADSNDVWTLQVGLIFLNRGAQVTTPTIAYLMGGEQIV
jgi:hypothetical protein